VVLRTTQGDITLVLFPDQAPTYTRHFLQEVRFDTFRNEGIWRRDPGGYVQLGGPDTDVANAAGTGRYELMPTWFDHNRLPQVAGSVVMNKRFEDDDGRMVRHEYALITGNGGYFPGTVIGQVLTGLDAAQRLQTGDAVLMAVDVTEP
ncbi:MAG TPA: peptidylprolyl isomerase, partial [Stenomitos sp.]